jgi:hypothetical protein
MSKVNLIRNGRSFAPATEQDEELLKRVRTGEIIACEFTKPRNPKFHRKFFALLNLAYEYWVPDGGLMPQQELFGIMGLAKHIAANVPGVDAQAIAKEYVTMQINGRSEKYPAVEKDFELFREWIISESGHSELKQTPRGIVKKAKSISFARMDETEFSGLYKSVFNVAWRHMLQANFASEEEAMAAADSLGEFA